MKLHLSQRWGRLHPITRVSMLAVIVTLLWWQSRHTWSVFNPMYGWPMPFNNVWYVGQGEWLPSILIFDIGTWLILSGSVGYVLEGWRRKVNRLQANLASLFVLQSVAGVVLTIGCVEGDLRAHPQNDSIFPNYARRTFGQIDVWFDIGLFTDPPWRWPLARIIIIVAIGCAVYSAGHLLYRCLRRVGRTTKECPAASDIATRPSPVADEGRFGVPLVRRIFRVVIWALVATIVLFLPSLFPPAIH